MDLSDWNAVANLVAQLGDALKITANNAVDPKQFLKERLTGRARRLLVNHRLFKTS
jgi:hypothetical protein